MIKIIKSTSHVLYKAFHSRIGNAYTPSKINKKSINRNIFNWHKTFKNTNTNIECNLLKRFHAPTCLAFKKVGQFLF